MPDRLRHSLFLVADTPPEHVLLSEKEHQERLRRWILYLWEPFKNAGLHQTDLANAIGVTKQTVGEYLTGDVLPGFECFLKLHFRQGLDPLRLLREEPREQSAPTLQVPTQEHRRTQPAQLSHRPKVRRARK